MISIVLTGEPKSTNSIYRYVCSGKYARMYMTTDGKKLKEQYFYEIKDQYKGEPIEDEVAVNIIFYFSSKRKRDIDNSNKLVIDSLNGTVLKDDSQITELHLFKETDTRSPRIEISVV